MWTTRIAMFVVAGFLLLAGPLSAQRNEVPPQLDVEPEPVAFVLGGGSVTAAYQTGPWRLGVEVYGVEPGEALHGNEGFDASVTGTEVNLVRFVTAPRSGAFAGVEVGLGRHRVTHRASGRTAEHVQYSTGLRAGYRWYTGLGDLYLMPMAGMSVSLNPRDVEVRGDTYDSGRFTPFATVAIGWSFGRPTPR